ncbi:hypothetical protein LTR04_001366, partial [Oleoguttula sp. CCFEE 6159]
IAVQQNDRLPASSANRSAWLRYLVHHIHPRAADLEVFNGGRPASLVSDSMFPGADELGLLKPEGAIEMLSCLVLLLATVGVCPTDQLFSTGLCQDKASFADDLGEDGKRLDGDVGRREQKDGQQPDGSEGEDEANEVERWLKELVASDVGLHLHQG